MGVLAGGGQWTFQTDPHTLTIFLLVRGVTPEEPLPQPRARRACLQQRGETWGPLGAHKSGSGGYLVSQPGAMVALHGEALGVTGQVCQGVLGGREDGEAWD